MGFFVSGFGFLLKLPFTNSVLTGNKLQGYRAGTVALEFEQSLGGVVVWGN